MAPTQQYWPRGGNVYLQPRPATGLLADAYINGALYIAHRGNPLRYPEHTMEAYAACVADGVKAIEQDCWLLSDGTLGVMHDSTVNRTTTSSGNTDSFNATTWAALQVDIGDTLGGAWDGTRQTPPLFSQVVSTYGNDVLLVVEAKNAGAGAAIVAELQAQGVASDAAIVQAFDSAELNAAIVAGYPTMWLGDSIIASEAQALGVRYIGCSNSASSSYISTHLATGREVVAYTIDRHWRRDELLALGVTGFFSDDSQYLADQARLETDPYATQTWGRGMLVGGGSRGDFTAPDEWGYSPAGDGRYQVLQGWACPIGGDQDADNFTIDFTVNFENLGSQWASIFVGADKDTAYSDLGAEVEGYHLLFRYDGKLDIYLQELSGATQLQRTDDVSLASNTDYEMRVTVTPTQITLANLTVGASVTATNSAYRGGYFHFGCRGPARPRFSNVTVTPA